MGKTKGAALLRKSGIHRLGVGIGRQGEKGRRRESSKNAVDKEKRTL